MKDSSVCEMNDSVDFKRHIYLRTIAKQNVYAEFDLETLSPTSAGRRQLSVLVHAYHHCSKHSSGSV